MPCQWNEVEDRQAVLQTHVDSLPGLDYQGLAQKGSGSVVAPGLGLLAWQDLAFAFLGLDGVVDVIGVNLVRR